MRNTNFVLLITMLLLASGCGGGGGAPAGNTISSYAITGKVAGANGAGLPGATVTATRVGASPVTQITDGNGSYAIGGLTNGDYVVAVTPLHSTVYSTTLDDFTPLVFNSTTGTATVDNGGGSANFTAQNLSAFKLSGKVLNPVGQGMANVTMTLVTINSNGIAFTISDAKFSTVTDASGNYSISGIPNAYYRLTPTLTGTAFGVIDIFQINGADKSVDATALIPGTGGLNVGF